MGSRGCLIAAGALLWASTLVIPLGAHLRAQSPRFPEYERQFVADIAAASPGEDLGPNMYFLAFWWPIVTAACVLGGVLFSVGALGVLALLRWNRVVGMISAVFFCLGCLVAAFVGLSSAVDGFRWGFFVLGAGNLMFAVALVLAGIGIAGTCRTNRCNGLAMRPSGVDNPPATSH